MYYVYQHINPLTNQLFYIGKGTQDRANSSSGRPPAWKAYVKRLKDQGLIHSVLIMKVFESEFDALEFERSTILDELANGRVLFNSQMAEKEFKPNSIIVDEFDTNWNRSSDLASFVRTKRKQTKLTQKQFADRAGVSLRFIRELESGNPTVRMDYVNLILHMFGYYLKPIREIDSSR